MKEWCIVQLYYLRVDAAFGDTQAAGLTTYKKRRNRVFICF